jgi:hypothetical protein
MITLSILILVLYAISIYKLKEVDWDFYEVGGFWELIAIACTVVFLITLGTTLIILIVKYLP